MQEMPEPSSSVIDDACERLALRLFRARGSDSANNLLAAGTVARNRYDFSVGALNLVCELFQFLAASSKCNDRCALVYGKLLRSGPPNTARCPSNHNDSAFNVFRGRENAVQHHTCHNKSSKASGCNSPVHFLSSNRFDCIMHPLHGIAWIW